MTKIQLIVDGGKAAASPQLAQTLGPMKINIQEVLSKVNEKTAVFKGVKVPVEIKVNDKDKSYEISVGSPSTGELIKKELALEKGSSTPNFMKVGNIAVEQVIKIAKMKEGSLFDKNLVSAMKTVAGSCNSAGVLIEGVDSHTFNQHLSKGIYAAEINAHKTDVSPEKAARLKTQLAEIQVVMQKEQEKLKAAAEAQKAEQQVAAPEKKEEPKEKAATEEKTEVKKEEKKEEKKQEKPKK